MNNYEKIKSMSIEEIISLLNNHGFCFKSRYADCLNVYYKGYGLKICEDCTRKWLESEAVQDEKNV